MSPNVSKWDKSFIEAQDFGKHPKDTAQKSHKNITITKHENLFNLCITSTEV